MQMPPACVPNFQAFTWQVETLYQAEPPAAPTMSLSTGPQPGPVQNMYVIPLLKNDREPQDGDSKTLTPAWAS